MTAHIQAEWEKYRKVLPRNAGPIQIQETRRAFYAGFEGLLRLMIREFEHSDPDATEADLKLMDEIEKELCQFAVDVGKGVA